MPSSSPVVSPVMGEHAPRRRVDRAVWIALVGHTVEWYEFSVYGVLAAYVAVVIFPSDDLAVSLMLTWAVFATAFLVRPIGGIVLSRLADRHGRRRALFVTVLLMTVATTCAALVPSYAAIGVAAPVIFLCLRLLQGFAVGGEMSSAVTYVMESVDPARRARSVSLLATGTFASALFGALVAATLASTLGADQMSAWGWRVVFALALPLGIVALLLRRRAPESPVFVALRHAPESPVLVGQKLAATPVRDALRTQRRPLLVFVAVSLLYNVALAACLSGYLSEVLLHGVAPAQALFVTVAAYVGLIAAILLLAPLAERWGRRRAVVVATVGIAVAIAPGLALGQSGDVFPAMLGAVLIAIPTGMLATPVYLVLSELFPADIRATSGALGFNTATAVSSLVPVTTLALRTTTGFDHALLVWVAVAVALALWASRRPWPAAMTDG